MAGNDAFGVPSDAVTELTAETPEQRIIRLREKARAQAAQEFNEDEVYAKLLADARAERQEKLLLLAKGVEFPVDTQGFPEEYDRVFIFRGNEQDLTYVPLGINGFVIKVPRDEEVILPRAFVTECLAPAIKEITVRSMGGLITRPAHAYPYQVRGPASPAEYKAYQAAQKEKALQETARARVA